MAFPTPPTPGTSSKTPRKRGHLTLQQKSDIIRRIEAGEKKASLGRAFSVNESTIRTIFSNRQAIKESVKAFAGSDASRRTMVTPKCIIVMERLLEDYIRRQEGNHMAVSASHLRAQATKFFAATVKKYPPQSNKQRNFKASSGWLESFIKRKKLKNIKFTGERATADEIEAERYPDLAAEMIAHGGYTAETTFNMDETGFTWKRMPQSTYVFHSTSQARGWKADKTRFTALLCVNASGSCKMKPMVVHQAGKPHAYRHLKSMDQSGVYWRKGGGGKDGKGRGKAWMSGSLTLDWFDNCFVKDARRHCRSLGIPFKVILFMDNAPCHPKHLIGRHKSVRVEFLPANTTSLLQPLDQEVTSNMKFFYQRLLYVQLLRATDTNEELQRLEEEEDEGSVGDSECEDEATAQEGNHGNGAAPHSSRPTGPTTTTTTQAADWLEAGRVVAEPTTTITATSPSTTTTTTPAASASASVSEIVAKDIGLVNITQFWKLYNIKHAINNMLAAWREVSVATINHSWRCLTPQLCVAKGSGVQCPQVAAEAVMSAARSVPGCGEVTVDEVMEVARDIDDTAVEAIMQEFEAEEDQVEEEVDCRDIPAGEPSPQWLSRVLSVADSLKELLEEDTSHERSDLATQKIVEAVSAYSRMHADSVARKKQAVITRYFSRSVQLTPEEMQREAEEEEIRQEIENDVRSVMSDGDFEGF